MLLSSNDLGEMLMWSSAPTPRWWPIFQVFPSLCPFTQNNTIARDLRVSFLKGALMMVSLSFEWGGTRDYRCSIIDLFPLSIKQEMRTGRRISCNVDMRGMLWPCCVHIMTMPPASLQEAWITFILLALSPFLKAIELGNWIWMP